MGHQINSAGPGAWWLAVHRGRSECPKPLHLVIRWASVARAKISDPRQWRPAHRCEVRVRSHYGLYFRIDLIFAPHCCLVSSSRHHAASHCGRSGSIEERKVRRASCCRPRALFSICGWDVQRTWGDLGWLALRFRAELARDIALDGSRDMEPTPIEYVTHSLKKGWRRDF